MCRKIGVSRDHAERAGGEHDADREADGKQPNKRKAYDGEV